MEGAMFVCSWDHKYSLIEVSAYERLKMQLIVPLRGGLR